MGKQWIKWLGITGLLMGMVVIGFPGKAYAAETEVPLVDSSKGITYIVNDKDSITGINLNGNSVIIKASANSAAGSNLNNIYIDANRNGIVDAGEEAAAVTGAPEGESDMEGAVDIDANLTVYGVYEGKAAAPVYITLDGGYCSCLYGVYRGEVCADNLSETAVSINAVSGAISTFYGVYYGNINGDMEIKLNNVFVISNLYGCFYGSIEGNLKMDLNPSNGPTCDLNCLIGSAIKQNAEINIGSGKYSSIFISSTSTSQIGGNLTVHAQNITAGNIYGITSVNIAGDAAILYEQADVSGSVTGMSGSCTIEGDTAITYSYVSGGSDTYMTCISGSGPHCIGDATICVSNITCKNFNAVYYESTIDGNLKIESSDNSFSNSFNGVTTNCVVNGNVSIINKGDALGAYTGYSSGQTGGNITILTENCTGTSYEGVKNLNALGDTEITIDGGTYTGSTIRPYYIGWDGIDSAAAVTLRNATFTAASTIGYYLCSEQLLTMLIEDSCTFPDNFKFDMSTSRQGGSWILYENNCYYSGAYPITESVTADNIYLSSGTKVEIPKGVSLTASEQIYMNAGSEILLEGTLSGSINQEEAYKNGSIYVNGGTLDTSTREISLLYYPLVIQYPEKLGSCQADGSLVKNSLRPDVTFARVVYSESGYEKMKLTCEAEEGYKIKEVKVAREGLDSELLEQDEEGSYSFEMMPYSTTVNADFSAVQIELGQTEADLSMDLFATTTSEAPLYNVADVAVVNDAAEGEVTYTVDKEYGLPDGLQLKDGKIFGTAKKYYENGKKTVIHVTGKNGTTADITLNITIRHSHSFDSKWLSDDGYHYHTCTCGAVKDKTAHTWDAGVVTKAAAIGAAGTKVYTCSVCGRTKTEAIPALGAPAKDTILTDEATKAVYKVTEPGVSVEYVKSTNTTATTITLPAVVTVDNVTYKVTAIADNAFKNNKKLKTVNILGNVEKIGTSAFQNCKALKKVKMSASVKSIGTKAFYGCKKLSSLTIGKNVTSIGNSAFQNCTALKKLTIPGKVNKIGSKAFYGCKKLTSITIKTSKLTGKKVGKNAFKKAGSSNYKKLKVKVPKKKLKAYKTLLKKKGLSSKAKVKK